MKEKNYNIPKISLFIFFYFISFLVPIFAQDTSITKEKLLSVADAVLKNASFQFIDQNGKSYKSTIETPKGAQLHLESPYNDWRYWNGVLNIAMIRLGDVLKDSAYKKFSIHNISFCFDNYKYFQEKYQNQGKWNYPFSQFFIMEELDDCGAMGGSVIEVMKFNPEERFKHYIEIAANHILNKQARLADGTLVRTFPYKWTLWADDLYMSISFLSRMGEFTGEKKYFDDAARQVINFNKYLFNPVLGLMYHYWYSDINSQGVAFWGRANGWTMLAQVDLLDRLPKNHPLRDTLLALFQRQIKGIARYQGPEGLWHQLLDKVDSYFETSCTAMFTYAIARAVNKGYIEQRYATIAKQGWEGVMTKIHPDGKVEGVCTGTGTSDDLAFYYHRPAPLNDVHGLGAVLLAGVEILKLLK
jgi:unsaturated rhamnogalacturonyl hydrolase